MSESVQPYVVATPQPVTPADPWRLLQVLTADLSYYLSLRGPARSGLTGADATMQKALHEALAALAARAKAAR